MTPFSAPDAFAAPAVDLSVTECGRLLRSETFGRVGITSGGLPCILPVRYRYDDGAVVFRTGTGSKLRACERGDVLAFEVDGFDRASGRGWTVLALGRASVITTEHEQGGLPTFDIAAVAGERNHYVSLHCEILTGRRLECAPGPVVVLHPPPD